MTQPRKQPLRESTQQTILVTGATGHVGYPLVSELLAAGHTVRALTRDPDTARLPAGAIPVKGNLSDTETLGTAFDGVTAAHLIDFDAATYSLLSNGQEIVDLAVAKGVRRVTLLAGGDQDSVLERAIKSSGLEWTRLIPVEFMSNVTQWADSIRTDGVIKDVLAPRGSAMVHDADIAAVAAVALTEAGHSGREYWLTGPQSLSQHEVVDALAEGLDTPIRFLELSREEQVAQWQAEGYGADDIAFFLRMRSDPPEAAYTVQPTVEQVTGRPARTLREWIAEHSEEFG